jgi:hypothetical protein
MPATYPTPSPLEARCHVVGIVKCQRHHDASCLIGQIKLTRIHVASLFLPGVRVKRNKKPSLYNVERSGFSVTEVAENPNFVSLLSTRNIPNADPSAVRNLKFQSNRMVGGGA